MGALLSTGPGGHHGPLCPPAYPISQKINRNETPALPAGTGETPTLPAGTGETPTLPAGTGMGETPALLGDARSLDADATTKAGR